MAKAKAKETDETIVIPAFNFPTLHVKIVGVTPLAVNAFPEKLKQQMREKRLVDTSVQEAASGKSKKKQRDARDFEQEYRDSLYPLPEGGYGFPAIAFKKAIVGACRQVSNLDMTLANRIIFVRPACYSRGAGCVKIVGKPQKSEVVVRLAGMDRPPDLRYRGEFFPWGATLEIEFNESMIRKEGILSLVRFAGKCEGVGEQRPSARKSTGDFGQFRLAEGKE